MKLHDALPHALLFFTFFTQYTTAARKQADKVLISSIKSLTLRGGQDTAARRVSAVPQVLCVGGNAKDLYEVDVMRCTNSGGDYDVENVQWTCKASLPSEFKLGSTEVICEGYSSPGDPYILKGSCGVEYRLVLTEAGEKKYGPREDYKDNRGYSSRGEKIMFGLCLSFVVGVFAYIIYGACTGRTHPGEAGAGGGRRWGGGGDDNDDNDPPPPYSPQPPFKKQQSDNVSGSQGWRPGFFSGAATGAAAAYLAGNRNSNRRADPMEGSSRGSQRTSGSSWASGGSSSPAPSSSRYESTGFGGTSRR